MTTQSVLQPFALFADRSGLPLTGGSVYVGVAGANPTTNPLQVYFDSALTVPAAQPIRTVNGFPVNGNAPARLFVNAADFSLLVQDSAGQLVFSALRSALFAAPATSLTISQSAEELAASVTPTDTAYAVGDNRRYSSFSGWIKVLSQGVEGHLWTDMSTATMATATGDISIHVHGRRSITATASMVNILRTQGRCTIVAPTGELLLDGDNKVTGACLHYEAYFPSLTNVRFLDAALGGAGGTASYDGNAYGPVGDFTWKNVVAENCVDCGWSLRGHAGSDISAATSANPIVMTAANHGFTSGQRAKFINFQGDFAALNETTQIITVLSANTFSVPVDGSAFAAWASPGNVSQRTADCVLEDCKTKGITTGSGNFAGSGRGFLFHVAGMNSYERRGGNFKGDPDADSTDGYKCDRVNIVGGLHDKVNRGVTIGFESQLVTIVGTAASELVGNGVSVDTTTGVGTDETTTIAVAVGNVVSRAARLARTTGSHISLVGNRGYKITDNAIVGNGNGRNLYIGDNHIDLDNPAGAVDIAMTENSRAYVGSNVYTSTLRQALAATGLAETNLLTMLTSSGNGRTVTADTDVRGSDRVLYLDTTAGAVDIDLPDRSEVKMTNYEIFVLWKAGANSATISFQGGAVNGETVNGRTAITLFPSQQYQGYRILCVDGETGTWVAQPAGLNFIQSASVTWNPANLANNGTPETTTVTVTGAIVGDFVDLSFSQDLKGCILMGRVTAADTVTAYLVNATGSAQDVANGTLRALVWRKQG